MILVSTKQVWGPGIAMSRILIDNLDDGVLDELESRARQSGRTLESELKSALAVAAQREPVRLSRALYRARADQVRAAIGDVPQTDSAVLLAEDRLR